MTIAVLPVQNLSGVNAPLEKIRFLLIKRLRQRGFHVLQGRILDKVMARHRMRYTGGINAEMSQAFRKEAGVTAVLITSLEVYKRNYPPKVALFSRLDEVGGFRPKVLWMDSMAMSGDGAPGLLSMGLISDPSVLVGKAVARLSNSLCSALAGKKMESHDVTMAGRFKPRDVYVSPTLDPGHKYKVLVVPFYNESGRANAGQIMQLQFADQLTRYPEHFQVLEPGLIRNEFLNVRIIQWDGISLENAKLLFALLDADLIVTGKVLEYKDRQDPRVYFDVIAIDRKSGQVVWSSTEYANGSDGVYFFDTGRINTAHDIASEMARWVVCDMVKRH